MSLEVGQRYWSLSKNDFETLRSALEDADYGFDLLTDFFPVGDIYYAPYGSIDDDERDFIIE